MLGALVVSGLLFAFSPNGVNGEPRDADLPALTADGRWREAEALARRHAEMDTESPIAWLELGRLLFVEGSADRLEEAMDCLTRAVELDPHLAEGWYWLGRAGGQAAGSGGLIRRMNLARQTRDAFTRSCELEPDNFRYTYALIQFFLQAPSLAGGDRERAAELASGFTAQLPAERALLEASVSLEAGNAAATQDHLGKVASFEDPLVAETWRLIAIRLAGMFRDLEDRSNAVVTWRWIVERFPDDPAGFRGLGQALADLDRFEEARLCFMRALELEPEGPRADAIRRELEAIAELGAP